MQCHHKLIRLQKMCLHLPNGIEGSFTEEAPISGSPPVVKKHNYVAALIWHVENSINKRSPWKLQLSIFSKKDQNCCNLVFVTLLPVLGDCELVLTLHWACMITDNSMEKNYCFLWKIFYNSFKTYYWKSVVGQESFCAGRVFGVHV